MYRPSQAFFNGLLEVNKGHAKRTPIEIHLVANNVPLRSVYEELLTRLRFTRLEDAQQFLMVLITIRRHLEMNMQDTCDVFQMSSGLIRERSVNEDGKIVNLYQGEAPVHPRSRRGEVYPGDKAIRSAHGLTVQVHVLRIKGTESSGKTVVADNVPTVAIWVPGEMGQDMIVQPQGGPVPV